MSSRYEPSQFGNINFVLAALFLKHETEYEVQIKIALQEAMRRSI